MHVALRYVNQGFASEPGLLAEFALAAEEAGIESLWASERVVLPASAAAEGPLRSHGGDPSWADPFVTLAYLAGLTSTIRLATGVVVLPYRHPLLTAKSAASLDVMSGGRLLLGVGVGWLRAEFDAVGAGFDDRVPRFAEYVRALRAAWASDPSSFDGETVRWHDLRCLPRPVRGTIPIVVGGQSAAAARRACDLGDGFFPSGDRAMDTVRRLRSELTSRGRDPASIEVTVAASAAVADRDRAGAGGRAGAWVKGPSAQSYWTDGPFTQGGTDGMPVDRVVLPVSRREDGDPRLSVRRPEDVAGARECVLELLA